MPRTLLAVPPSSTAGGATSYLGCTGPVSCRLSISSFGMPSQPVALFHASAANAAYSRSSESVSGSRGGSGSMSGRSSSRSVRRAAILLGQVPAQVRRRAGL
jgi:hypothetical protein